MKLYYRLAPGVAVIDMKDENILFKSDTLAVKLGGASTLFLAEKVLPLLNGENDIEQVCAIIKNIAADDLTANLNHLVKAGVLSCSHQPLNAAKNTMAPYFNNFLTATQNNDPAIADRVANFKIAVIGLEAHGTQTVLALQQAGISNFKLIDPYPGDEGFSINFPFLDSAAGSRQESLKKYLIQHYESVKIETLPHENVTKENLEHFTEDCHLIIVCADKNFAAVFYWANQISIDKKIPALYASIKGHTCLTGPFVIPGKTSCYMCYKMRTVATQEDFEEAMLYEEYLNNKKIPAFSSQCALPGAINHTAAILSGEVLKYIFSFAPLSLPDKILEFNTLSFETILHSLQQKPGCPVCQKKNPGRNHYSAHELIQSHHPSSLGELLPELISTHTGIIKQLEVIPKDISEPALPLVYMAVLANHTFLPKDQHKKLNCSGKGMDKASALISAGGEAVERYSGTMYSPDEVIYTSYNKLAGTALNPEELVLYSKEQYAEIGFSPFNADTDIGWVQAYSLVNNTPIYIPIQSTVINYNIKHKEEYLCQATSNGLAAGATLLNAVLSAAGEVIERDAFIIAWANQLPSLRIDPLTHPSADIRDFYNAYLRRGVELQLYKLPTDAPCHVFMGIGLQVKGDGPTITVGLGADFDAAKAARGALLEVGQVRPAFKQRLRMPQAQQRLKKLLADPNNVEDLEDHDLLYGVRDKIHAFDFLFNQPVVDFNWRNQEEKTPAEQLQILIDFLAGQKSDLIYYNLTPPDMQQLGLYTTKVIIPGFQPIHFGHKNIRLGGNRLFELPQKLGFRKSRVRIDELNPNPHPLA